MTNRLSNETSPYLLQHAKNPVDWYPWGLEAFAEATRRDIPVFLSIGYSTCHWCHVMARESFEDEGTAQLLNSRFVCVKVDREERPDVDSVYMAAMQAISHHGGWPMSLFLSPQGELFYAGSYWPKVARDGRPAFVEVAEAVWRAWEDRRGAVAASAQAVSARLSAARSTTTGTEVRLDTADRAALVATNTLWDTEHGGFGQAPKFPQAMTIEWLLYRHARTADSAALDASVQALEVMARGGIHDQLDGGFARYCTDENWLVPHFEKMLYDNALLLPAYAAAASLTGRGDLARTARSTAEYLLTKLRTDDGAFASATDAESGGVEGGYFVWAYDDVAAALTAAGVDPIPWCAFLGASASGNWQGTNILHEAIPREQAAATLGISQQQFEAEWIRLRHALSVARSTRPPLRLDTTILTDWNALAIRGLVRAGLLLDEPTWIDAAAEVATFLHERLFLGGRLQHLWRAGRASIAGFFLDHAALALADLELFQATGEDLWFTQGLELATHAHELFHDDADNGWFDTSEPIAPLNTRPKATRDDATPSGTSVMVEVCLILAGLTGDVTWSTRAREGVGALQPDAARNPTRHGWLLRQIESMSALPREIAIVGRPGHATDALLRTAFSRPRPGTVIVAARPNNSSTVPLLLGRGEVEGVSAAYVCENLSCQRPVISAAALSALLT
ncbi:thioredoxin domain-containing protein [Parafrigoribacterium soli]|uniref:thioredoxin domain-containing protein n=1 Tax=Parafrigoribacterium soli TaxID=3144663 RepID=UPI0032EE9A4A